jgi:hypothetical protein
MMRAQFATFASVASEMCTATLTASEGAASGSGMATPSPNTSSTTMPRLTA